LRCHLKRPVANQSDDSTIACKRDTKCSPY
jgi:hypothetical protein